MLRDKGLAQGPKPMILSTALSINGKNAAHWNSSFVKTEFKTGPAKNQSERKSTSTGTDPTPWSHKFPSSGETLTTETALCSGMLSPHLISIAVFWGLGGCIRDVNMTMGCVRPPPTSQQGTGSLQGEILQTFANYFLPCSVDTQQTCL